MKKCLGLLLFSFLLFSTSTFASPITALVVVVCGSPPYSYQPGTERPILIEASTGNVCTNASGGGGGGGAVTIADGADDAQGSKADTAYAGSGSSTVIALLKGIYNIVNSAAQLDQTTPGSTNGVNINPTSASTAAIGTTVSTVVESNHVLKASAGNAYGVYGESSVAGYLMVFDATSAPSDGAVTPKECVPAMQAAPTNSFFAFVSYGNIPASFTTGIVVVWSTTGCFTKTASATAFFKGRVK